MVMPRSEGACGQSHVQPAMYMPSPGQFSPAGNGEPRPTKRATLFMGHMPAQAVAWSGRTWLDLGSLAAMRTALMISSPVKCVIASSCLSVMLVSPFTMSSCSLAVIGEKTNEKVGLQQGRDWSRRVAWQQVAMHHLCAAQGPAPTLTAKGIAGL